MTTSMLGLTEAGLRTTRIGNSVTGTGAAAESGDQVLSTIVIGLITLVATLTVMYLIARGRRSSD